MCVSLAWSRLLRLLLVVALGLSPALMLPGSAHAADIGIAGTITGTPYGAGSADPLPGVTVALFAEGAYVTPVATDTTDAEGAYSFSGIEPGSYKVRASKAEFKTTWYAGYLNPDDATALPVNDGDHYTGISWNLADATTEISGAITGTPYSAGSVEPLPGAIVGLFVEGEYGAPIATDTTDALGMFAFPDVEPGSYKVRAAKAAFKTTWYAGYSNPEDATTLPINEGDHYTGISWNLADATTEISGTITGTPFGAGSVAPLPGATVGLFAEGEYGAPVATDTTDALGEFAFPDVEPGSYKLRAAKAAFKTTWYAGYFNPGDATALPVNPGDHYTGISWNLGDATTEISGSITGTPYGASQAESLDAATVELFVDGQYGSPVATTTTVAGEYSLPALEAGNYKLRASKAGFKTTWYAGYFAPEDATTLPVNDGDHYTGISWNLADATTEISGSITGSPYGANQASPQAGASVGLFAQGSGDTPVASTVTDAQGDYSFPNVAPGTYELRASKSQFQTMWYAGTPNRAGATALQVTPGDHYTQVSWHLPDATTSIEGQVFGTPWPDYQQTALGGATVELFTVGNTDIPIASDTTAADGSYAFDGVAAGDYKLRFSKDGWQRQWYYYGATPEQASPITIAPGVHYTGVSVWLSDASIGISGTITGWPFDATAGVALSDAQVALFMQGDTSVPVATVAAGPGGTYAFTGIEAGTYLIRASAPGYVTRWAYYATSAAEATPFALAAGDHIEVDLALEDASTSLGGTVYATAYPSGEQITLAGVTVKVFPAAATNGPPTATTQTGGTGNYQFAGLPAGSYKVQFVPSAGSGYGTVWYGGSANAEDSSVLDVTAGSHLTWVDAYLTDTSTSLAGTVNHGAPGNPVNGATVSLFSPGDTTTPVATTTTAANGSYSFVDLPAGNYLVKFTAATYATQWYYGSKTAADASPLGIQSGTHATGIDAYLSVPGSDWEEISTPTITGTPEVGAVLTAVPGTWSPVPTSFHYQWAVGGSDVAGATAVTFTVPASAKGQKVTVTVYGVKAGFPQIPQTSAPLTIPSWKASDIPPALGAPTGTITVSQVNADPSGVAISSTPVLGFPRSGPDHVVISSGDANEAAAAGDPGTFISTNLEGSAGADGNDLTQLVLQVTPPSGSTCLIFDFVFASEEFPEYVGSSFNDVFTVETPSYSVTKQNGQITAPNNVAVDLAGNMVSINTVIGLASMPGTVLDGATPLLIASVPVTAGQTTPVVLSVQDIGDSAFDSAVFIDSFRFGSGGQCSSSVDPVVPITGPVPTVSGGNAVGATLTVDPGTWAPDPVDLAYQWAVDGVDVPGATGPTFSVTGEHVGSPITVTVTGSKPGYQSVSRTSDGLEIPAGPAVTGPKPVITGTPSLGGTLTADPGEWLPAGVSLSYVWKAGGAAVPGATGVTFVPGPDQVGKAVTVSVTGAKDGYASATRTSDPTAEVATGALTVGTPTLSTPVRVGQSVTASTGTWSPVPEEFSYQWRIDGAPVPGGTGPSFLPEPGDLGKSLTVSVTGSRTGYTTATATSSGDVVTAGALSAGSPSVSGTAKVGETLTAVPGTWGPVPVELAYQWRADGSPVAGATSSSFAVPAGVVGKKISVAVTGTKTGYAVTTVVSGETAVVAPGALSAGSPSVSGTAKVGETLTADSGTWGPAPVDLAYQWLRNGSAIPGATQATYLLTVDEVGASVSVMVTGTKPGYEPASATSAATQAVVAAAPAVSTFTSTPVPQVTGTARVGEKLTAVPGAWIPADATLAYQWLLNGGVIAGATASTLVVPANAVGKRLSVRVTGSKAGFTSATATSAQTAAVVLGEIDGSTPKIKGTPKVGQTLKAVPGTWKPTGVTLKYQWKANGKNLKGATKKTLVIPAGAKGKRITVTVTATLTGYAKTSETSKKTLSVTG